ncbi:MAG: phasin family protein [Proteobacteria bacterium]|nr:phasin family protein [Pseudomonadota bacterium]
MNQFVGNFDTVLKGMDIRVPSQFTEMMQANLDQAILVYEKAAENVKFCSEIANSVISKQQAMTREFGEKAIHNANANVSATLDVAKKLAVSRSVQEALQVQTAFVEAQTKRVSEQVNELVTLAVKAGSEAMASWSSAVLSNQT